MADVNVIWAANHWQTSVDFHSLNHPGTAHICQDLNQFPWVKLPPHDLMLIAFCCHGFTRARGKDQPRHATSRSTAWAAVAALEIARPPVVIIENVPDIKRWPLWQAWCDAIRAMGYAISSNVLDAADAGVPQNRLRIFIVLTRSKAPLTIRLHKQKHVGVRELIRWDVYPWLPVAEKCANTQARVANGRAAFGDRFIMPYYGSGSGLTGRSLDRPMGTITTRARWGVVDGDRQRMLQPAELAEAMSFPRGYKLPPQVMVANQMLGNAVCPLHAAQIIREVKEAA